MQKSIWCRAPIADSQRRGLAPHRGFWVRYGRPHRPVRNPADDGVRLLVLIVVPEGDRNVKSRAGLAQDGWGRSLWGLRIPTGRPRQRVRVGIRVYAFADYSGVLFYSTLIWFRLQADEEKLFNDGDVSMVRDPESARIRLGEGAVAVTVSNRVARKLSETALRVSQMMSTHVTAM